MISLEYFVLRLIQKVMNKYENEQTEIKKNQKKLNKRTNKYINITNLSINYQLSEGIEEKMQ